MTANHRARPVSCDPLYETARQTAGRLTTSVTTVHRLINEEVIPARSINGSRKIPKLATGLLLARAYEIWPPEYRPQYTPEELRRLAGITVEAVAPQLGISRTGAYEAVGHEIPAIQLPGTDRRVVPEDAAVRMEAYDLKNFTLMSLPEHRQEDQPLESEADDPATDDKVVVEDAANAAKCSPAILASGPEGRRKRAISSSALFVLRKNPNKSM